MESRKKRNLEIERQKRSKQRAFTAFLAVAVLIMAGLLAYAIWDNIDRRTIMTFEGTNIATTDFRFFHMLQPDLEIAREESMEALIGTLAILERAERSNITLTAAQRAELLEEAAGLREQMNWQQPGALNFISNDRIADFFSVDLLLDELMEVYVTDYEVDEAELAASLAEHVEELTSWLTMHQIKYVSSENPADLPDMDLEGAEVTDFFDFAQIADLDWFQWDLITNMPEGETIEQIEIHGIYYRILMYAHIFDEEAQEILDEEIENFRDNFTMQIRAAAFVEILDTWIDEANYTINQRALDRF